MSAPFDFWNDHSLVFLEMAMKRDYQERVIQCDGKGEAQRDCGDTICFFIKADQGRLVAISYDIQGCIYTHACANTIIHLTQGRPVEEAAGIGKVDILSHLETLPEAEEHCADLALLAFGRALKSLASG